MANEWARGLSQQDFNREFMRRYPRADFVPDASTYIDFVPPVSNGIDGVRPDDYKEESVGEVPEVAETQEPEEESFECIGCGRTFTHKIGKYSHERKCKEALKKKFSNKIT